MESSQKLYETCYMRVYSYVMTLVGAKGLAEEITQETFFRAIRARESLRGDGELLTWLCAIARNLFHDEMRRYARQGYGNSAGRSAADSIEEIPDPSAGPLEIAADKEDSFRIHRILHAMEEPYKEVFEFRCFGELSFRQIGSIFGKTGNWARVTYHRPRIKLQERMEKT